MLYYVIDIQLLCCKGHIFLTKLSGVCAWCVRSLCDLKAQLRSFWTVCCYWFCSHEHPQPPTIIHDHPRPLRPVVQSVYDLPTISIFLGRNMVVSPVWLGLKWFHCSDIHSLLCICHAISFPSLCAILATYRVPVSLGNICALYAQLILVHMDL